MYSDIYIIRIDPRIAGRVLGAGGVRQYLWRTVPAVPLGGAYPPEYREAGAMLITGTSDVDSGKLPWHFLLVSHDELR